MKISLGPRPMLFPTPVVLVGSYKKDGAANLMCAAWAGVVCSKPPCIAVSLRPMTHSHGCIKEHMAFTASIPSLAQLAEADYMGMASGRDQDKLARVGWTTVASELVDAPYPAETPISIECKVVAVNELGLHTQFVGQVMDVKVRPDFQGPDGEPDPEKIKSPLFLPGHKAYHAMGEFAGPAFSLGKKFMS